MSHAIAPTAAQRAKQSYWRIVIRQFRKRRMAVASLFFLLVAVLVALASPFLAGERPVYLVYQGQTYWFPNLIQYADLMNMDYSRWEPGAADRVLWPVIPFSPERSNLRDRLAAPNGRHLLGTDDRGRDILSRMIWGTRISMSIGLISVSISVLIGVVLGALAGYYRGAVDAIILRIIEVFLTFPSFFLILAIIAFLPPSIYNIMVAIGLLGWTGIARLVRGEFLRLREADFAWAARASGLRDSRVIFRHLVPNALGPVWVSATFGVAGAILTESALSFLGFGAPPPTPSWGEILSQSKQYLDRGAWWLVVFPGVAIFLTVTAFNLVGSGLRDAMDPRLRQ